MMWALFYFLINSILIHAGEKFEFPKSNPGFANVLVLSSEQAKQVTYFRNFGSETSPGGNCWGMSELQLTLLTQVDFKKDANVPEKKDSTKEIQEKLWSAWDQKSRQTIVGFDNLRDFMEYMQATAFDIENPLRKTIERIQDAQNGFINYSYRELKAKNIEQKGRESVFLDESKTFINYLNMGIPVRISIRDPSGGHALTVVGYQASSVSGITKFFTLDSNKPNNFTVLELKKEPKPNDKSKNWYWYYEPWDTKGKKTDDGNMSDGIVEMIIDRLQLSDEYIAQAQDKFKAVIDFGDMQMDVVELENWLKEKFSSQCNSSLIKKIDPTQLLNEIIKNTSNQNQSCP